MEAAEELTVLGILLPTMAVLLVLAVGVVLLNRKFRNRLLLEALEREQQKQEHQHELLRKTIEVQERERGRIAQDLHDELGATLSMVHMSLSHLQESNDLAANTSDQLTRISTMLNSAIAASKNISHALLPLQLKTHGLVTTLRSLAHRTEMAGKLSVALSVEPKADRLPWPVRVGLYRICTELCNNTIKHANASHIELALSMSGERVLLHYMDDGIGLDSAMTSPGIGLASIEARAQSLGGSAEFQRIASAGFCVSIEVRNTADHLQTQNF